ncbi:MAG: O-acetyl-ADP-ribose deacetylase [Bacteroidia bacterium]
MKSSVEIIKGDITKLAVDVIVNAANTSLLGGGGVDGAIHRAAGPELLEECRILNGCKTGEAKMTRGYGLPAKFVIHTPGPVWRGGHNNEDALLASCYRNALKIAAEHHLHSIAFPSISTGIYGFPFERAARIAIAAIQEFLNTHAIVMTVKLIVFSDQDYERMINIYNSFYPEAEEKKN